MKSRSGGEVFAIAFVTDEQPAVMGLLLYKLIKIGQSCSLFFFFLLKPISGRCSHVREDGGGRLVGAR